MENDPFDLKKLVIKVKLNAKNTMLAQVELKYGSLRLFGYRIMSSQFDDGLYVQPPSINTGKTWLWLARIDNPEKWQELQHKIKEQYKDTLEKYEKNNKEQAETKVDPDEIPI